MSCLSLSMIAAYSILAAAQDAAALTASVSNGGNTHFQGRSSRAPANVGLGQETVVSDQLTNHVAKSCAMTWSVNKLLYRTLLPAAVLRDGIPTASVRTQRWNTWRPVEEGDAGSVTSVEADGE